jgi:pyruvate/2-oxoglutarate dehydrogenase complex dihydrolipoamide dehydrogenase (E3) component
MLEVDMVLYSGGRDANSEKIGCENVGVKVRPPSSDIPILGHIHVQQNRAHAIDASAS